MANNKVVLANGTVLLDLTGDTVDAEHLMQGYTAHDKSGAAIVGTASGGGGGVPLPSPVTAGDTPVYFSNQLYNAKSRSQQTAYSWQCEKAGTYRIKTVGCASNRLYGKAWIYVNNTQKITGSFETTDYSTVYWMPIQGDVALNAGDTVTLQYNPNSTSYGMTFRSFAVCINWNNTF